MDRQARLRSATLLLSSALAAGLLAGCGDGSSVSGSAAGSPSRPGCITDFDENTDYFPDKVRIQDAVGFSVEYHRSYKVVTVKEPTQGGSPETYVLVRCGAPDPKLTGKQAGARRITVPVTRIASSSTTQLPGLEMLGALDTVVAVGSPDLVNNQRAGEMIKSGKISGFSNDSGEVNVEKVAASRPDLYLAGGMDGDVIPKLVELKIPVVADSAWLEESPLGRAEWLKYEALFLDAEKKAEQEYATIARDYRSMQTLAGKAKKRPAVLTGKQYEGTWQRAGGRSYVAAFVRDAGGDYVFADTTDTGTSSVDIETVLARGGRAPFWLNAEMTRGWKSTADIVREDSRFANLEAVRKGAVWSPVRRINQAGGNDYWESGVLRPDVVLKDLVAILHPELLPEHEFVYYVRLGSR
ncbi:MAG: cobalamin transport system substrate-binding protein [Actinomycetota bacterium]|nr:cobalamin transport system substrate-binding protein [Actinomycetota bacterium]